MIYVNSVTSALHTILSSDSALVTDRVNVDLYRTFNSNRNRVPWVGVVRPTINITPRRANITQPWVADYVFPIVVQTLHGGNRHQGELDVDKLLTKVMTAVNCNRNLLNTVCNIQGFDVTPIDQDVLGIQDSIEDTFQMYQINLIAEDLV